MGRATTFVDGRVRGDVPRWLAEAAWLPTLGPFEALGQRLAIRTVVPELADYLSRLYEPMRADAEHDVVLHSLLPPTDDRPGVVVRGDEVIRISGSQPLLLGSLIWSINRQVIERSLDRLILHAAAAESQGATVVLPAPMESGKTTLVTGLLDRGLGYLTDEAVAVDGRLELEGYPKPLSVDPGSWGLLAHHEPRVSESLRPYLESQWQVPVHPWAPVARRGRLALLVFPRYERGAALRFEPLTPATTVREALPCTFAPEGEPIALDRLRLLAGIAERVPAFRLVHEDLEAACERILEVLATASCEEQPTRQVLRPQEG